MRIVLTRSSGQRHLLTVIRSNGSRDSIELVTREALFHDLLHYAVESTMATQGGFWGLLAKGKTMADLNDRSGEAVREHASTLYAIEAAVGMMTGVLSLPADQAFERIRWYHEAQQQQIPRWCTQDFVTEIRELMRQLQGRWRATPFGESMEIAWEESAD